MDNDKFMVVGVDGSPEAKSALNWADAGVSRYGPIQPVIAWGYPWWVVTPTPRTIPVESMDSEWGAEASRVAEEALEEIEPSHRRETLVLHGTPGPALVDAGRDASLLVVGTRRRSRIANSLLGSVSFHCVNHATVPVAVVPPDWRDRPDQNRVVVGIDGSENSQRALEWALTNTQPDSTIDVVFAWDPDSVVTAAVAALAREQLHNDARRQSEDLVAAATSKVAIANRRVEIHTPAGDPRSALQEAATNADLLVLGARGHQRVAYILLGSVATALVNHPELPTVVIR